MSVLMAFTAAVLFGIGTYLLLQRKLSRLIIGLGLIGHGANIVFVTAGRRGTPPLIGSGDPRRLRRSAPAVARADGDRHQLRRHRAAARARLPQLAADPRRRGAGRRRGPQRRPATPPTPRSATRRCSSTRPSAATAAARVAPLADDAVGRGRAERPAAAADPAAAAGAALCILAGARAPPAGRSACRAHRPRRHRRHPRRASTTTASSSTQAGDWPAPIGITLVADRLSAIMLVTAAIVLLAVLVYAIGQPGVERNHVGFQSVYMILAAGVAAAFLTGDLFNLFVAIEMMLTASYVLHHARRPPRAGARRHDLRRHQPGRVGAVPRRPGVHLRRHRHRQHGRPRRPHRRAAERRAGRARRAAARRVRHQGGAVPAVLLAARQLPDRTVGGDGDLRRAAHEGRHVRHHPHPDRCCSRRQPPDVAAPRRSPAPRWSSACSAPSPRRTCRRIFSFYIVSQIGYIIMGLGLFTVAGLAGASSTSSTTSSSRRPCSSSAASSSTPAGRAGCHRLGGMVAHRAADRRAVPARRR